MWIEAGNFSSAFPELEDLAPVAIFMFVSSILRTVTESCSTRMWSVEKSGPRCISFSHVCTALPKMEREQVRFVFRIEKALPPSFEKQDREQLWFAHTSNSGTWEDETGRLWVQAQTGIHERFEIRLFKRKMERKKSCLHDTVAHMVTSERNPCSQIIVGHGYTICNSPRNKKLDLLWQAIGNNKVAVIV